MAEWPQGSRGTRAAGRFFKAPARRSRPHGKRAGLELLGEAVRGSTPILQGCDDSRPVATRTSRS